MSFHMQKKLLGLQRNQIFHQGICFFWWGWRKGEGLQSYLENCRYLTRDMCFPGTEHISLGIRVSLGRGTQITRDTCFSGEGTHITRDTCFSGGEHISQGIRVFQVGEHISLGIRVSQVGEHISLGIRVSQVGEHISLGIRVSQVGEHTSLGICVSRKGNIYH